MSPATQTKWMGVWWLAAMGFAVAVPGWGPAGDAASGAMLAVNLALLVAVSFGVCLIDVVVTALVASMLGDRWIVMQIGSGPQLLQVSRTFHQITLHLVPAISKTVIVTTRRAGQITRLRITFGVSGLVLIGVAAASIMTETSWSEFRASLVTRPAPTSIVIVACLAYGLVLIATALSTFDAKTFSTLRAIGYAQVVARHLIRGDHVQAEVVARRAIEDVPESEFAHLLLVQVMSARDDERALALATDLLERATDPVVRAGVERTWAWQVYDRQLDDLRPAADRASLAAIERDPASPSVRDTRGHVLLWLGRLDEAEPILRSAHETATEAATRASAAAGLAILHARRSRIDDAHHWLELAREEGQHSRVLARAVAEVEPLRRTPA